MSKITKITMLLVALFYLLAINFSVNALYQRDTDSLWVYAVVTTTNTYDVVRIDMASKAIAQVIYSLPKTARMTFGELMPQDEIDFAQAYYQQQKLGSMSYLLPLYPDTYSVSIEPSPDRQNVVVNIFYRLCVHPGKFLCFGSSQLVVVQSETGQATVLWNMGLHSKTYASPTCLTAGVDIDTYQTVGKMAWTGDGKAIAVSFTGDPYCYPWGANLPVFMVEMESKKVIEAGQAVAWDLSKLNNEIYELSEVNNSYTISLSVVQVDRQSGTISAKPFMLDPSIRVNYKGSVIRLGDKVLFDAPSPDPNIDGWILSAFKLTSDTPLPMVTVPQEIQSAETGQASPDGTQALVETSDKALWLVQNQGDVISAAPLGTGPVSAWAWLDNSTFLYRSDQSGLYVLADRQGHTLKQIDLAQQVIRSYLQAGGPSSAPSVADFQ